MKRTIQILLLGFLAVALSGCFYAYRSSSSTSETGTADPFGGLEEGKVYTMDELEDALR